jgi:hypothetical protein
MKMSNESNNNNQDLNIKNYSSRYLKIIPNARNLSPINFKKIIKI